MFTAYEQVNRGEGDQEDHRAGRIGDDTVEEKRGSSKGRVPTRTLRTATAAPQPTIRLLATL